MARHRKPLSAATPPELLTFRVEEWSSFDAWCAARRDWVKAHPDSSLGSMLDVLKEHRRIRHGHLGWKYWVARHRRPQVDGPPAELLEFRPDDWLPDVSPYWAWLMARFEWCRDHPNDFSLGGDVLDMLRARRDYRRGRF